MTMKGWQFERMFPADLREAVRTFPVAFLSLSPLEWHGEACALGCDPALGYEVCRRAWERTGGVLLPPLYVGTGNNFAEVDAGASAEGRWEKQTVALDPHPGSLFVRPATLELVLSDYLYFLRREGFRLCAVVSGHGAMAHMATLIGVCQSFSATEDNGRALKAHCWRGDQVQVPEELRFPGAGDHADFSEASALGAIDPSLVRVERFAGAPLDQKTGLRPENASRIDFGLGGRLLTLLAGHLAADVLAMAKELGYVPGGA
jgi:creatinine amidohydrolase